MPHPRPLSSRVWSVLLLAVVLPGCRSCTGGSPSGELAQEDLPPPPPPPKERAKQRLAANKGMQARRAGLAGPKADLMKLTMRVPTATEELRAVSTEVEKAKVLVQQQEPGPAAEARQILTTWLESHPDDADAHYWLGRSWQLERVQVQSIDHFNNAVKHDPEFLGARRWLSYALQVEKRCADALPHLTFAVDARDDEAEMYVDRAICEMAVDDWDAALTDLQKGCELEEETHCASVTALVEREARRKARLEARKSGEDLPRKKGAFKAKVGTLGGSSRGKLLRGKRKAKSPASTP